MYEAGNRVLATLAALRDQLGAGRGAAVARELTKRFETFLSGSLGDLAGRVEADAQKQMGEFVILVEGRGEQDTGAARSDEEHVLRVLATELPLKQAAALAARITGGKKNRLYALALAWRDAADNGPNGRGESVE